jgi:ribosomal protein S18 acetylase RimI-like enzyme
MVFADDGTPAAFASLEGEAGRVFMDPAFKGNAIGPHLAARLEAHARERGSARVMQQVFGTNDAARALLAARGYRNDQHYWRMRIDLAGGGAPEEPAWPKGMAPLRFQRARDELDAHRLIQRAFGTIPGNVMQTLAEWRASWGRDGRIDPELSTVVVRRGGEIAGIATCAVQEEGDAYLAQLAVDEPARGLGLGRALLLETFRLAEARGVPAVALDVNAANENATPLYESAGMHAEWHTDRWVKQIG